MKIIFFILIFLFLSFLSPFSSFAGDAQRGKEVYERYCWWCHGEKGEGDGPASAFLNPPPRDFTYGLYKWKSTPFEEFTPAKRDFYSMVSGSFPHGDSGRDSMGASAMPAWKDVLKEREITNVIEYIKAFAEIKEPEKGPIDLSKKVKASEKSIERGAKLFKKNCSECHGKAGRGDGEKRLKDDFGFRTWPRNLTKPWTFRAGSTPEAIYTRITVGIAGTQMPSLADPESKRRLSAEQRWDIANYVQTLAEPYKKPGPGAVINALRVEGALPETPEDPLWDKAPYKSFYTAPQVLVPEKEYTPTIDSISVKALYNGVEAALLIAWDDPTESVPGDRVSMKIAGGEVFRDAVAVQFPLKRGRGAQRPYFGMGGPGEPVNIWHWQGRALTSPERVSFINSRGYKKMEKSEPRGLFARGFYDSGRWRVIMKRRLKTMTPAKEAQFQEGVFMPVAFAAWDGSNNEKGSRHVMTSWYWLYLEPKRGFNIFLWSAFVFLAVCTGEFFIVRNFKKG